MKPGATQGVLGRRRERRRVSADFYVRMYSVISTFSLNWNEEQLLEMRESRKERLCYKEKSCRTLKVTCVSCLSL
jgi:hypothetical protein